MNVARTAGWVSSVLIAWTRWRPWEEPLRRELQARPLTFRARVDIKVGAVDPMESKSGSFSLSVRGDAFEVSDAVPLFRFLDGQDYCYRARDTTVEVVRGVLHDWIEICPRPGTGPFGYGSGAGR